MHIVFSTKHREPLILPPYEAELHSYLGGICKSLECTPIKIGGYTDHVHVLCMQSKKIALMKLLEVLKANSSKWIKTLDPSLSNFYWQDGYGAFSVTPAEVGALINYIANQHDHHNKYTFQDEYREILKYHDIAYDERYVWD